MPGMHSPALYPLLIVIAQAVPSASTAETLAVEDEPRSARQAALADPGQQVEAVGLEVAGEVVDRRAVGQHRALDLDHVVPGPVPASGQLAEHHREHRAADGGRRVDGDRPVADVEAVRRPHDRLVRRQVVGRDQARRARPWPRPAPGPTSPVEKSVGPVGGELVEGVGRARRCARRSPPAQQPPPSPVTRRVRLGVVGERACRRRRPGSARRRGSSGSPRAAGTAGSSSRAQGSAAYRSCGDRERRHDARAWRPTRGRRAWSRRRRSR